MNIIDAEDVEENIDEIDGAAEIIKPNTEEGLFYQDITTSTENSTINSDQNTTDTSENVTLNETTIIRKNAENSEEIVFEKDCTVSFLSHFWELYYNIFQQLM